jgi:two-component system OmpR family sensor kinase
VSLRVRLLAASLVLVLCGLVAADVATFHALRSFLVHRVDDQLAAAHRSVERALFTRGGAFANESLRQLGTIAPGVYVQVRDSDEQVLVTAEGVARDATAYTPKLPAKVLSLVKPDSASPAQPSGGPGPGFGPGTANEPGTLLTVGPAQSGGPHYRVRVSSLGGSGALVVALPLTETTNTLHQLLRIEVLVTAGVLVLAIGIGLWLVRLGLRPLADIEATAQAITGGDFAQRVGHTDDRTEVGRLGGALNVMLDTISESEQAARASEERMRRFVGDASHELRTPVAAVRAYAELYRMGADRHPEDLGRLLSRIEMEAERMGVLVNDLLLLARLDEGRPLEMRQVDLGGLTTDAVEAARVVDPTRTVSLDVAGSVEVVGDRGRLRQVIDNLLANVRAHTGADAPADVRVWAEDGNGIVEVADRGPGLTDTDAEHVFERFYRADPARSRDSGGVGLGLSIVGAIAAAHGGTASAGAREGGGAVFRVAVPLVPDLEWARPVDTSASGGEAVLSDG